MKINYFLNSTCGGIKEICFYDEDKYDEGLAFGHELYIDVYYPEYDIEETTNDKALKILEKEIIG